MNPLALLAVFGVLAGGIVVEGWLLLGAHEKLGDLKVKVAERDAIIKQKEADAKLSDQLLALQTFVESKLKNVGNETRQAISNASSDDAAATAARDGILRLKSAPRRSGPPAP